MGFDSGRQVSFPGFLTSYTTKNQMDGGGRKEQRNTEQCLKKKKKKNTEEKHTGDTHTMKRGGVGDPEISKILAPTIWFEP